jgi:hypothetical protein
MSCLILGIFVFMKFYNIYYVYTVRCSYTTEDTGCVSNIVTLR